MHARIFLLTTLLLHPQVAFAGGDEDAPEAVVEGAESGSEPTEVDQSGWLFRALFIEEYRGRSVAAPEPAAGVDPLLRPVPSDESDHDIHFFTDMGLTDPGDHFQANLSLALFADVDGSFPGGRHSALASIYDYDAPFSSVWFDAYVLSAEYHSEDVVKLARGGRQVSELGLPVTFDGASLVFGVSRPYLDIFVFGGRTHHFFELDADLFEDWIASTGFVIRPTQDFKIEIDYRLAIESVIRESRVLLDERIVVEEREDRVDHSYGLTAWYRYDDWFNLKVDLHNINEELAEVGAACKLASSDLDMGADVGVDAQLVTLRTLAEREDPFFAVLGESKPYVRWRIDLWKDYRTKAGDYGLHLGWNARELFDGEESLANRNVGRIYLQVDATDIVVEGPFVSAAAEVHYQRAAGLFNGDYIVTAGGSAGYAKGEIKAEAGTFYQKYKYDYYRDLRESEDVRTYFGSVTYEPLEWLTVRGRYEYERLDRDVHTFTLALSQTY